MLPSGSHEGHQRLPLGDAPSLFSDPALSLLASSRLCVREAQVRRAAAALVLGRWSDLGIGRAADFTHKNKIK